MVYSIDSIIPFFENDVLPFAKLALPRGDVVRGCLVSEDDDLVMLLDHKRLMADPGLTEPAKTCSEVYNVGDSQIKNSEQGLQPERRTFIFFSIGGSFAIDTRLVSEVINKPDKMLEPPYAFDFVEGIINLRGELITLIDLRRLYGMEHCAKVDQKVVIFTCDGSKYAVVVDSVDEIMMTTVDNISEMHEMDNGNSLKGASEDVTGFLECNREDGSKQFVMIMDGSALIKRCGQAMN